MPYTPSTGQLERLRDIQTALNTLGIQATVTASGDKSEEITFIKGDNKVCLTALSTPIDGAWFVLEKKYANSNPNL